MRRLTTLLILLTFLVLLRITPTSAAWFFEDDTLVSIDGQEYSVEDFKRWWKFYNDKDYPLPQTPDHYIEWLLLSREGERMQLDSSPGFQRQTRIFLLTRGLLMLRNEAVISRIKITDADVKARYEEKYLPRWLVKYITFKNEAAAATALQELETGKLTVKELLERDPENGGPVKTGLNWLRPNAIAQNWTTLFQNMDVGKVAFPSEEDKGPELYYLVEKKGGDEEDFAKFKEEIRKEIWKEQEDDLTRELLDELRETYQVQIDEERLAAIDINAPEDSFTDDPIITTNRENVSEKQFMAVVRKLRATRTMYAHIEGEDLISALKDETVNNIITQSLTNWAALDRHYEEKEPMKWEYEFNYKYRLMSTLEERLFAPEAEVSDEEIKRYYQENINLYTQPSLVRLYIIDETQGPIDQIWADATVGAVGDSFPKILKKHFELDIKPTETPVNHIDHEVRAVVDKLSEGETSQIFRAQGIRVMVHLVERVPEAPLPLEGVRSSIRKTVREKKINDMVKDYVAKLKSASEINVREKQWKAIQKELGGV